MAVKVPAYLKKGSTIGIVCPSGYMAFEKAQECIRVLQEEWGFKVKIGTTLGSSSETYFSGTDEERLADLQMMLDDDDVDAVLFGRGGYGMSHIIDRINFKEFKRKPKWVVGFSDITLFHLHVLNTVKVSSLHAPMAAAFNNDGYKNPYVLSLFAALKGRKAKYQTAAHHLNQLGEATAPITGGNLALVVNSIGTPSEIDTKNKILFLEDIGEQKYSIDRMMWQLKRGGKLKDLKALIIGKFTDIADTERPFGADLYATISNLVKEYNYPVCFDFPISHDPENYAIKMGFQYKLSIQKTKVVLQEIS